MLKILKDKDNKVVLSEGTLLNKLNLAKLKKVLEAGGCMETVEFNQRIKCSPFIIKVKVYKKHQLNTSKKEAITVIGVPFDKDETYLTVPDIVASLSYLFNMIYDDMGQTDDIDHLSNRNIKTVSELLQNQFRIGLLRIEKNVKEKMSTINQFKMKPNNIINCKPLTAVIGEFFNLSQLCHFLDQTNPLSELTNKRRITALGMGGLSREHSGLDVRDVHYSHYGRICPIETPEGPNIGLINNLAVYARINKYGFYRNPLSQS